MTGFDFILKQLGAENIQIYEKTIRIDSESGADIITYEPTHVILGCIQPSAGLVINNTPAGGDIHADLILYTQCEINEFARIHYRSGVYEIRKIKYESPNFLKHFKYELVKVSEKYV